MAILVVFTTWILISEPHGGSQSGLRPLCSTDDRLGVTVEHGVPGKQGPRAVYGVVYVPYVVERPYRRGFLPYLARQGYLIPFLARQGYLVPF